MPSESQCDGLTACELRWHICQTFLVPFLGKFQVARSAFYVSRNGVAPVFLVDSISTLLLADIRKFPWNIASFEPLLKSFCFLMEVNVAG